MGKSKSAVPKETIDQLFATAHGAIEQALKQCECKYAKRDLKRARKHIEQALESEDHQRQSTELFKGTL